MTVLIVDDEPAVLRFMAVSLQTAGYEVLLADGGDEALAFCEARAYSIDLMISDVAMPKMNGSALAECMNRRHPDVPIVFVSGYPESRGMVGALTAHGFRNGYTYLQKPFAAEKLLAVVRTVLATPAKVGFSAA
jgi:two-component system, cell cycle sensor histidine kinase and response regulator CckA